MKDRRERLVTLVTADYDTISTRTIIIKAGGSDTLSEMPQSSAMSRIKKAMDELQKDAKTKGRPHEVDKEALVKWVTDHCKAKPADKSKDATESTGKDASEEMKEKKPDNPHEPMSSEQRASGSPERKNFAAGMHKLASSAAANLRKNFPHISNAANALKSLATNKPLDHHEREVLQELGHMALESVVNRIPGGRALHIATEMGVHAVNHAIKSYKDRAEANPKEEPIEGFVHAVADGIEKAEPTKVRDHHLEAGSPVRVALNKHVQKVAPHIAHVVEKTFPGIKHGVSGLKTLAKGGKMSAEETEGVKKMGKAALMTTIATLPGGLPAHLAMGLGATAISHAIKNVKKQPKDENVLIGFIKSIGEGLEHAVVSGHLLGTGGEH